MVTVEVVPAYAVSRRPAQRIPPNDDCQAECYRAIAVERNAVGRQLSVDGCGFRRTLGRILLQKQEDERDGQQNGYRQHADRRVASQRRRGSDEERADDRRRLAENIVEAVVLVGMVLRNDLAVIRTGQRLDATRNMPTRIARIQNSSAARRKNAAKKTMHMYATTAAVIMVFEPNRPASLP